MLADHLAVAAEVTRVLERLGVPYQVVGSIASSFHGIPRSTQDVDLTAVLASTHVQPLVEALQGEFYVDLDVVRDAVLRRTSFNVIHFESALKVDVFVLGDDAVSAVEMARATRERVSDDPELDLSLASAEDTVLHKLRWYRLGGGVSDLQWRDVLGVLKVQGDDLDLPYLRQAAEARGLAELLGQALVEAGRTGR